MKTRYLLWSLIRFRFWVYLLLIVGWLLTYTMPLLGGEMLRRFMDSFTSNTTLSWGNALLLWLLISVIGPVLRPLIFFIEPLMTQATIALLTKNILLRLFALPAVQALTVASGDAVSRFRDDTREIGVFLIWSAVIFGRLLFACCAITIMLSINALVTLIALLPIAAMLVLNSVMMGRIQSYRQASRTATSEVATGISNIFQAIQAIKVATAEASVIAHFRRLNERRRQVALRERIYGEVLQSFFANTLNLVTGLIVLISAQIIAAGTLSVGTFLLFVFYAQFLMNCFSAFGMLIARYRQVATSFERLGTLLQEAPLAELVASSQTYLSGTLPSIEPVTITPATRLKQLEVVNLSYQYPGTLRGISNITFQIQPGTLTVITGGIGSGKTTLLRVLLGLLPCSQGEIIWNELSIEEPAAFLVPPRCAYTPQQPHLFSGSIRDNILLGQPSDKQKIEQALDHAILTPDLMTMRTGVETIIGPRGVRLSGGQIQRVAAARMFTHPAELLLFDDLSSALDVETEQALWQRLTGKPDTTFLAVTQRRALLQRADNVLVLKDGMLIAQGTHSDLLATCPEFQRLWHGENRAFQDAQA
ncbi:ABC transporter ATP-binding protein [Ktedonospora formicarum]|uniref:HlyB/MsbA family ABC transporter n=1 Tax=Ktedonospora formicarum TaxID=2778364 RepID=A0A8J3MRU0_9CHLR|nr:ABC transporter ATP-binding protein [Ktedonospora formicarum]GHO42620.1 HlyB/MsbA family ABC transporter [Ktedonospora formicarum]